MKRMHSISSIATAVALACAAPFALAQTAPTPQHPESGAMTHTPPFQTAPATSANQPLPPRIPQASQSSSPSGDMMGQHDMTGTVRSVSSNGIVEVHTGVGNLRVHFPDASQNLKKGEKITLHLSYSVSPSSSASM